MSAHGGRRWLGEDALPGVRSVVRLPTTSASDAAVGGVPLASVSRHRWVESQRLNQGPSTGQIRTWPIEIHTVAKSLDAQAALTEIEVATETFSCNSFRTLEPPRESEVGPTRGHTMPRPARPEQTPS